MLESRRHSGAPGRLDVVWVTSVFPAASEAFAAVEVKALERSGCRLRIRAFRFQGRDSQQILRDLGLRDTDITHFGAATILRGSLFLVRHPLIAGRACGWLIKSGWRTPLLTFRCLLLMPRFFEIFAECLGKPPDVLHLYWGHYPAIVGYLVKRYLPQVHVSLSLMAFDLEYRFGPSLRVADQADSIWTGAKCNVSVIRSLGITNPRLSVLYKGIDLDEVPQVEKLTHKKTGKIVTISRLVSNKAVDDALRVLAEARKSLPALHLVVIGEGPERKALEKLATDLGIESAVCFRGAVAHAEVYRELADADIMILMSRNPTERLPNSVKEAMACRCICIVTESPGIEELREPLKKDMVVRQGDWMQAANLVIRSVGSSMEFDEDRDAGRKHIFDYFDARVLVKRRLAAWDLQSSSGESDQERRGGKCAE